MMNEDWISQLLDDNINHNDGVDNNQDAYGLDGLEARWRTVAPTLQNTFLTINQAETDAWRIAKTEIDMVQARILVMCHKHRINDVNDDDLIDIFFGPQGVFTDLLTTHLQLEKKEFDAFMARFCLISIMRHDNTNVTKLLRVLDVNISGLMSEKKFNEIYKLMSNATFLGDGRSSTRRPACLWEKLQPKLNKVLHDLLVTGRDGSIGTVIDDDKVWCGNSGRNAEDRRNIKYSVHVRDNRRGFNIHAFSTFFTFFPLHVMVEREGDSSITSLKRGLQSLFGCTDHGMQMADSNFFVGGDRGYLGGGPAVRIVCKSGGDICGTTKRGKDTPFTTGSLLDSNDSRILLETSGAPCLYVSQSTIEGKRITATAFRTGTGTVCNAISSKHHGHWWDAQTVSGSIARPRKLLRRLNITEPSHIGEEETLLMELEENKINVITTEQGRACWHLLRKFSLTSHQAISSIRSMFSYYWKDSLHSDSWIGVVEKLYGPGWQYGNNNLVPIQERDGVVVRNPSDILQHFKTSVLALEDEYLIVGEIKLMVENNVVLDVNEAQRKINAMTKTERKGIMIELSKGITEQHRVPSLQKKYLELFLTRENDFRKWMFYSREYLLGTATVYGIKRSLLNTHVSTWAELYKNDKKDTSNSSGDGLDTARRKGIKAMLERAFHSPFTGSRKADCELGHKNEPKIITNFVTQVNTGRDAEDKELLIPDVDKILAVYTTGLVEKQDKPFAKDSIDFLAIVLTTDGEVECWGGEVKTRTRQNTKVKEFNYQSSRFPTHPSPPMVTGFKFSEVSNNIQNVDERTQLLHHAYVYDSRKLFFLIGDSNAQIIHADVVEFTPEDLEEYGCVVTDVFDEILLWAYPEEVFEVNYESDPSTLDIPRDVLDLSKTITEIGGEMEIRSTYFLWLTAYLDVKRYGPMPSLHRIIPMQHAWWNVVKPGGDNITQLIESLTVRHPHVDFETRPSTRLIQYGFVTIHRLKQVLSARIERYSTITQYRHCASKRSSFLDTMLASFNSFQQRTDGIPRDLVHTPPHTQHRFRTPEGKRFTANKSIFTSPPTTLTPTKRGKAKTAVDETDAFSKRRRGCMGPPVIIKLNTNGFRCSVCGKKTTWMCQGCHMFVCHGRSATLEKAVDERKKIFSLSNPQDGKTPGKHPKLFFVETCFLASHPALKVNSDI